MRGRESSGHERLGKASDHQDEDANELEREKKKWSSEEDRSEGR